MMQLMNGGLLSGMFRMSMDDARKLSAYERALKAIAGNTCCEGCREAALVAQEVLDEFSRHTKEARHPSEDEQRAKLSAMGGERRYGIEPLVLRRSRS